jgi:hypothetical protein
LKEIQIGDIDVVVLTVEKRLITSPLLKLQQKKEDFLRSPLTLYDEKVFVN